MAVKQQLYRLHENERTNNGEYATAYTLLISYVFYTFASMFSHDFNKRPQIPQVFYSKCT